MILRGPSQPPPCPDPVLLGYGRLHSSSSHSLEAHSPGCAAASGAVSVGPFLLPQGVLRDVPGSAGFPGNQCGP